jgi:hypothetical protein
LIQVSSSLGGRELMPIKSCFIIKQEIALLYIMRTKRALSTLMQDVEIIAPVLRPVISSQRNQTSVSINHWKQKGQRRLVMC